MPIDYEPQYCKCSSWDHTTLYEPIKKLFAMSDLLTSSEMSEMLTAICTDEEFREMLMGNEQVLTIDVLRNLLHDDSFLLKYPKIADDTFYKWMQETRLTHMVDDQCAHDILSIDDKFELIINLYDVNTASDRKKLMLIYELQQYHNTPLTEIAERLNFKRKEDDEDEDT